MGMMLRLLDKKDEVELNKLEKERGISLKIRENISRIK